MQLVYKIIRFSAWILVFATVTFIFTGFMMTKYVALHWISYDLAKQIHTVIITMIFIPLFYIHSMAGFFLLFARHKSLNNKPVKFFATIIWTGVFILFIVLYSVKNPSIAALGTTPTANTTNSNTTQVVTGSVILSTSEIAKHNSANSCWFIVNNNVYDVTNFLNDHPAGPSVILPYCGKDATQAYDTKNIGVPHSSNANSILASYLLGSVGQTINGQQINNVQNQTIPANSGRNSDD